MQQSRDEVSVRLRMLETKLGQLQRSNHRLRMVLGAFALIGGALLTMAQTDSGIAQSLEARQFVLRDGKGSVRAVLGSTPDGAAGISLHDASGGTRLTMDVEDNGSPGLDLYDAQGKRRAIIALSREGTPGIGLYDTGGQLRTSIDIPAGNTPGLAFYHRNGKPSWGVP